jgi:hypothetical protein
VACSSCIRGGGAVVPPGQFDPMMRWAGFEGDVAAYPASGYDATANEQMLTLGTGEMSEPRTSVKLTVRAHGVPVNHAGWQRAADDERVNGRPTFWRKTWIGALPFRQVEWEYLDGDWATVDFFQGNLMPPVEPARAVATTARFGRPERVKLPLRFTEPLPGMRIERVRIGPFVAAKRDVDVGLYLRGADYDGRVEITVAALDGQVPRAGHTDGYTTVDGLPARRLVYGPNGYHELLRVWGVGGMKVTVSVYGERPVRDRFAPDGAAGVVRRLAVVDDPARWS